MDATRTKSIQYHNVPDRPLSNIVASPLPIVQGQQPHCNGDSSPGEFLLSAYPSIVLHVLTACNVDPQDLARLEATCSFFRQPANISPDIDLSLSELAALDMCQNRAIFKLTTIEQRQDMKQRCGGSWKLVLRFLLAGEVCCRREKSQAAAGAGHSVAVTSKGVVYSFGLNNSGQLGHGITTDEWRPQPIRYLQGIRITQAAVGAGRTMLISDAGLVYAFGEDTFGKTKIKSQVNQCVSTPQLVESLKDIFVVQVEIGDYFTAVLSREGRVYTISWGSDGRIGHHSEAEDKEPHPLLGALEHVPVVQIASGHCFLLCLAWKPKGMSVYSVGCGKGGMLGHGSKTDEKFPRLIEQFDLLNLQPIIVAAGAMHSVVVGHDGRVCTWGFGNHGCLGHGSEDCELVPKVVEALSNVHVVHAAVGVHSTYLVSDEGDVYSFGHGNPNVLDDYNYHFSSLTPELVTSWKHVTERVVQISLTKSYDCVGPGGHTLALAESGKLYAFGFGKRGQLGVQLGGRQYRRATLEYVDIDLS